MKPPDRANDLLQHMIVSCNRLAELRSSTSYSEFKSNYRVHELALRFIESLGEAARRIERLDPDWFDHVGLGVAHQVIGMRNRIAHQYEGVDLELVWQVLVDYAPGFVMPLYQFFSNSIPMRIPTRYTSNHGC